MTMSVQRMQRITWSPVVVGGDVGLLAGFAVAAALIALGEPWYTRRDEAVYGIVYWLDFPIGPQITRLTGWGWEESQYTSAQLAGTAANGLFVGAAGTAFVRGLWRSARLRRTIAWATAIELPLILVLQVTGIPSPFAGANLPATAATAAHAPAFFLLGRVGLCCGYESHFIVSDWWPGDVQHPTTVAMIFLMVSNTLMFVVLAYAGPTLWRRITRGRDRRRAAAPVAPG